MEETVMKYILKFLRQYCKLSKIIILVLLQCLFAAATFMVPEVFKIGIEAIEAADFSALTNAAALAVSAAILYIGIEFSIKIYSVKISNHTEKQMELAILRKMLSLKTVERKKTDEGKFLTIAVKNAEAAALCSINSLSNLIGALAVIICGIGYMGLLQWQLTVIIVVYNLAWQLVSRIFIKRMEQSSEETVDAMRKSNSLLVSILQNMMSVRIFNKGSFFDNKWSALQKNELTKRLKMTSWSSGYMNCMWAVVKFSEFAILYGIGALFVYKGKATLGTLLALTFAIDFWAKGIDCLTSSISAKAEAVPNINAIEKLLADANIENGKDIAIDEKAFIVRVENVSFSFEGKKVLNDVTFDILPGERVLIKGENGCGKSTLLNLICGIYRPDSGKIIYGSTDTTLISMKSMADKYAYISQESNILDADIFGNVALSEMYDKDKVYGILQKLNIENVAHIYPASASQGERQRINIARAIYKSDSACLVVGDEIFSNVDAQNAVESAQVLINSFKDCSAVFVAHTKMPIKFDKIIYIKDGKAEVKRGCSEQ